MAKLIAILNVVAWSGFWAFGYLALASGSEAGTNTVIAILLAALGGAAGMWAYFWLIRHSEMTGYAKPRNRAVIEDETAL
ncbi:hypothetical protein [Marivita sp. S2033]|uniref:hypothetical protein n=1 Tax=Marivita sp. S2033 TaxID=3373187 RepID=UPI0039821653